MIYDDASAIQVTPTAEGVAVVERETLGGAIFRIAIGGFLMLIGGLVMYVMGPAGQMRPLGSFPANILAWAVVLMFFVALGMLPFGFGFELAFTRERFFFSHEQAMLHKQLIVYNWPIWSRGIPMVQFNRVLIRHERRGPFAGSWYFIMSCAGRARRVELAAFRERAAAEAFAANIGPRIGLPVVFECPQCDTKTASP